jgi:hypothetical protein
MNTEKMILAGVIALSLGLILFIPKNKKPVAQLAFLFKQMLTWILGLIVVEYGLIEYPVRFFTAENRSSLVFEFLAFPAVCGVFNAYFPAKRSWAIKAAYYFTYATLLTLVEVCLEKYTDLIKYIHWTWYCSWIMLLLTFVASRLFCNWFFKQTVRNQTSTMENDD